MQVIPIHTRRVTADDDNLFAILDESISALPDCAILAISAKIVSLCQGRTVPVAAFDKEALIKQEAERWLPFDSNPFGIPLTLKDNILTPMAGIDESNGGGVYILWPENPQQVVNEIRAYLCQRFDVKFAGVLLTDSNIAPLRMGTLGVGMAHSGFRAVNDYRGQPDLFGQPMRVTTANLLDGLAATAVLVMGEGNEQTPLALLSDLPFVEFQSRNPTDDELSALHMDPDEDLYAPLLQSAPWQSKR